MFGWQQKKPIEYIKKEVRFYTKSKVSPQFASITFYQKYFFRSSSNEAKLINGKLWGFNFTDCPKN